MDIDDEQKCMNDPLDEMRRTATKRVEQLALKLGVTPRSDRINAPIEAQSSFTEDPVKVHANMIITLLDIGVRCKSDEKVIDNSKSLLVTWRGHITKHYPKHSMTTKILLAMDEIALAALEGRKAPTDAELGLEESANCFIATAACGADSVEVKILRQFRDAVLLKSVFGRIFVRTYYRLSPPMASMIKTSHKAQDTVRSTFVRPLAKYACKKLRQPRESIRAD